LIIVYSPAGAEPEHYDVNLVTASEGALVQRTIDQKWSEVLEGLPGDDIDAMRGIVWVLKKRNEPGLRWGDFDPPIVELATRWSRAEVGELVDAFVGGLRGGTATPEQIRAGLEHILPAAADREHAERVIQEAVEGKDDPDPSAEAAPSGSSTSSSIEASTSDSSPTSSTSPRATSTP
jgi:hypothetical protein